MAYANSVDPYQTAPEVAVWSELFAILLGILGNNCIKSKILAKKYTTTSLYHYCWGPQHKPF